jgi:hypothetical protein
VQKVSGSPPKADPLKAENPDAPTLQNPNITGVFNDFHAIHPQGFLTAICT